MCIVVRYRSQQMPQYCDTEKLESAWYLWILAKSNSELEVFRRFGVLYTKALGKSLDENDNLILKNNSPLDNPSYPFKVHCLALPNPILFYSYKGILQQYIGNKRSSLFLQELAQEWNLASDLEVLMPCEDPLYQHRTLIPELLQNGFHQEKPLMVSWQKMLSDINQMCVGIGMNFNLRDEELYDLAGEAYMQVLNKLTNNKLVYTPGRAPVFNLLTTTIYRCMYSIMNRRKNQREGLNKLLNTMQSGRTPSNNRSLRIQTRHKHSL